VADYRTRAPVKLIRLNPIHTVLLQLRWAESVSFQNVAW
jgi:hypothetical protein